MNCYVTTSPLRDKYLPTTISSLQAAGFSQCLTVSDGPNENGPRHGWKYPFKEALWHGAKAGNPFCVVEDDIIATKGLVDYLNSHVPSRSKSIVSLYSPGGKSYIKGWQSVNLTPVPGMPSPWFSWGACGYFFPNLDVVDDYLKNDPQLHKNNATGSSIAEFCSRREIPLWVHNPSLVKHIGADSVRLGTPLTADRVEVAFLEDINQIY